MGKAALLSLLLGCIHAPRNKPAAYAASAIAIIGGSALAYGMTHRSCSGDDELSCKIGGDILAIGGITLAATGLVTLGITTFAPDAQSPK